MALLSSPSATPQPDAALAAAPTPEDVVSELDESLRRLVRAEGLDPQREVDAVRRLAEGVVREHDERSLTGVVAPVADAAAVVAELVARVSGFGPLQPLLDDPEIEKSCTVGRPDKAVRMIPRR
ncbi:hypothetical protein KUV85_00635 [Nocardioides panacisoli]|uniref:hypothetical protein n=1 Tax=Nocardioides panacisoli TaxID=627624 RepID=UPI001C628BF5|nr:hypothetical protein [Nocardioides panacisoli]QYJ04220.1 hypothetical protein KUV85_00635 [Nocardioides panacisoli]